MALSIFDDKSKKPPDDELAKALGRTSKLWDNLKARFISEYNPLTETWKYSGKAWGWSLQLSYKKRTVIYLTPCKGFFHAGFALGEKAVKAARTSDLPASILKMIDDAKKYAEGRAIRLEIRSSKDVANVQKLVSIKMAN
jgi:hypothetical protein